MSAIAADSNGRSLPTTATGYEQDKEEITPQEREMMDRVMKQAQENERAKLHAAKLEGWKEGIEAVKTLCRQRCAETSTEEERYHLRFGTYKDYLIGRSAEALELQSMVGLLLPPSDGTPEEKCPFCGAVHEVNGCRIIIPPYEEVLPAREISEPGTILRRLLWLRHGCTAAGRLYGDDGEMQCHECGIDFKRISAEDLEGRWRDEGTKKLAEALATRSPGIPDVSSQTKSEG